MGTVILNQSVSVPPGQEMILNARVPNVVYRNPALIERTLAIQGLELVGALVELTENAVPWCQFFNRFLRKFVSSRIKK